MAIKELVTLVPPPEDPIDVEGDWGSAEVIIGAPYPADLKQLIARYGSGRFFFDGHLEVFNPLTLASLARTKTVVKTLRVQRDGGFGCTLPIHPEPGGLLPRGWDENGNMYAWLTKGKADRWPVIYLGHGSEEHPLQFRTGVTGFLAGYATDRYEQLAQPADPITADARTFTPGRDQAEVARRRLNLKRSE